MRGRLLPSPEPAVRKAGARSASPTAQILIVRRIRDGNRDAFVFQFIHPLSNRFPRLRNRAVVDQSDLCSFPGSSCACSTRTRLASVIGVRG